MDDSMPTNDEDMDESIDETPVSDTSLPLGHKLSRAKPVVFTFYDFLQDYPYTTTFYVREATSNEQVEGLVKAVVDVSACVLGKYKIGYEEFLIPDYRDKVKLISPNVMGTFKWAIKYQAQNSIKARSITIPGRSHDTSLRTTRGIMKKPGKRPDPKHPLWVNLIQIFTAICVSKENMAIENFIELDYTDSNWPPKGAKKRR